MLACICVAAAITLPHMQDDKRWIQIGAVDAEVGGVEDDYAAAEGQRVESIRWCETHGERAHRVLFTGDPVVYLCNVGRDRLEECEVDDEATLILPPKEPAGA